MTWRRYAAALLLFNALGLLAVYGLQRTQQWLPMNARGLGPVSPDLAFNTAVSFATNTNWQAYSGESTMSALTQMLALTVQNFLSAATGIAVLIVLIRGLIGGRKGLNRSDRGVGDVPADASPSTNGLGSFWIDLVRSTVFILLPLSMLLAVVLVSQGVVQTLDDSLVVPLLNPTTAADGTAVDSQSIPGSRSAKACFLCLFEKQWMPSHTKAELKRQREAGNIVNLDSNPIKLIEIGEQLLMTHGALPTSVAMPRSIRRKELPRCETSN